MTLRRYRVPGRIEFLGKHTDYAGGRSLLCATAQGISVVARPRQDSVVRILDEISGEAAELPLHADLPLPKRDWSVYPATVVRRLSRDFGPRFHAGLDSTFRSDLPRDAGLSSSGALITAVALALADANGLPGNPAWRAAVPTREALAGYLGAVENGGAYGRFPADGGVGTQGGSQDHTAILCSKPGMLVQYGFDPVRFERAVPFPTGHVIVVAVSGVMAAKTRDAMALYNGLAETARELLTIWQARHGGPARTLYAAITGRRGAALTLREWLAGHPRQRQLEARLDQFVAECEEIIPAVTELLAGGGTAGLGELIDRSQLGAEQGLGNQVPETIHLQRGARRLGATAASAFGAGFGGSVWALVPEERLEEFTRAWSADYLRRFPAQQEQARFVTTRAGPPAGLL